MTGVEAVALLPEDWRSGTFVGRIETAAGPTPVLLRHGAGLDVSRAAATVSALLDRADLASVAGTDLGGLESAASGGPLLAPVDLQCIKAAGVTFAVSAIERVIEERVRGDARAAAAVRGKLEARVGGGLRSVVPGSAGAAELKALLIAEGLWSQYLEGAIGPEAESFTKAQVLAGGGAGPA